MIIDTKITSDKLSFATYRLTGNQGCMNRLPSGVSAGGDVKP